MAKTSKLALILSLSITLLITACGDKSDAGAKEDSSTTEAASDETEVVRVPLENKVYRATVDELRLREKPDTDARVLAKLPLKQEVVSLNEESEETYTATLGGKRVTDVWRKVKLANAQGKKPVEGWAFGGGLEEVVISYDTLANGDLQRNFEDADYQTVASILGLDLKPENTYSGTISYRKTTTGLYLPNGRFQVTGSAATINEDYPDHTYTDDYQGQFVDGKLDGAITREVIGYEVYSKATIFFRNGRCEWGKMREEGEGMVSVAEVPEMATCTFRYLEDGLELQE